MKYLIYADAFDAIERNHETQLRLTWPHWQPQRTSDTPYKWQMIPHPTDPDVALAIADEDATEEAGYLSAGEVADLDDSLTPDWTPEEVI